MRHNLCGGSPAPTQPVHTSSVVMAPSAALLIALAGFTLAVRSGDAGAPCSTVTLATVALATYQNLRLAASTQEKPAGLFVQDTSGRTPVMAGL